MILFSRSFVRKRVISLTTTAAVAATSLALEHGPLRARSARLTMPVQYVASRPDVSGAALFVSDNESAMRDMMTETETPPTDNIDREFVAIMLRRHQQAIDMAQAVLRYGHNKQLRQLAQQIVVSGSRRLPSCALPSEVNRPQLRPRRPGLAYGLRRRNNSRGSTLGQRGRARIKDMPWALFVSPLDSHIRFTSLRP
jgi:hypothetical protein